MYDIVIIGVGVIGILIFRELIKYNLKVLVLEKEKDVFMGISKVNLVIVYVGYDFKEGILMVKFNVKGNEMFEDLCKELSVLFKRNGLFIIVFNDEDMNIVYEFYENGIKIGVKGLKILIREEVLEKELNLSDEIVGVLYVLIGGIVGLFEYIIVLVENGVVNGGEIKFEKEVVLIEKNDLFKIIIKDGEVIEFRFVINVVGFYVDKIYNLICKESFKIILRSGEYFVMDKS